MMKQVFVLTVFSLLCFCSISQSQIRSTIDSLKKASVTKDVPLKIFTYNQLAWEYRKLHPDTSIYYLNKSLDLIENSSNRKLLPETFNFMGVAYWYAGDFLLSYDFHEKAKNLALQMGDSLQYAHALNSLGRLYDGTGAYDQAIEYYNHALAIFKRLHDNIGLAYIYSSLGVFYKSQRNFDKAEEMVLMSLELRKKELHWAGVTLSYIELSRIFTDNNKNELAFDALLKAEEYSKRVNENLVLKAEIDTKIAEIYRLKKEYSKALGLIQRAETIINKMSNQNLSMKVYSEFGNYYYDLEQYDKAIEYHKKVVTSTINSAFLEELKNAYLHLAADYEKKGDLRLSYDYFKKNNEIITILLSKEKTRLAQQYETRLAIEKRAKDNELLRFEQRKNSELLAEQELRSYTLMGIVLLTFLLLVTFMVYSFKRRRDNRLLTIQKDALAEINLQKDTLMNILTHDLKAPFNRILGLCDLVKIDKESADKYGAMIQDATNSGLSLIKNIMDINRLENSNSQEDVTSVNVQQLFNLKIENYREEADRKQIELNKILEVGGEFVTNQMYLERICDNLLSNAIKYSTLNSKVDVVVRLSDKTLLFTIKDSGPGFTEQDQKFLYQKFKPLSARPTGGEESNGLGLSLVKTLVDKLNGKIVLNSKVGEGSTFEVMLPEIRS